MDRARTCLGDKYPTVRGLNLHALACADQSARLRRQIHRVSRCARRQDRARHENEACGECLPSRSKSHEIAIRVFRRVQHALLCQSRAIPRAL